MEINVTEHAKKRIKERMGIKGKAAKRQFALALERGTSPESSSYIINQWAKNAVSINGGRRSVLYNNKLFMYDLTGDVYSLLTVLNIPKEGTRFF